MLVAVEGGAIRFHTQTADLAADVGLGIEPRAGDSCCLRDAGERHGGTGPVELAQGLDGFCAGQLVPAAASFPSPPSASRAAMILSRLSATCRFISATRAWGSGGRQG